MVIVYATPEYPTIFSFKQKLNEYIIAENSHASTVNLPAPLIPLVFRRAMNEGYRFVPTNDRTVVDNFINEQLLKYGYNGVSDVLHSSMGSGILPKEEVTEAKEILKWTYSVWAKFNELPIVSNIEEHLPELTVTNLLEKLVKENIKIITPTDSSSYEVTEDFTSVVIDNEPEPVVIPEPTLEEPVVTDVVDVPLENSNDTSNTVKPAT